MDVSNWALPQPLRPSSDLLMAFPINALPLVMREMAKAIAQSTSTDPAMAGTAMLSAVSYCFSGMYRMCGKREHAEPLVLDTLIIAEPSMRKSPVISLVKNPYIQFTSDWNEQNKSEIYKIQSQRKVLNAQLSLIEKKEDATADEIAELQMKLDSLPQGSFCRIAVDDITPEALVKLLKENQTLLMISDEAGMLANFNGRYSNMPNLDLFLKSWSGENFYSDRVGRETITLKRPYMSVCLACQPYVFENIVNSKTFHGSGLIARFLYCFPKNNIGTRKYDTVSIPQEIEDNYNNLIFALLASKFNCHSEKEVYLYFDEKAYKEFAYHYDNVIEAELLTKMAFCRDWGGKYHGQLLRICGIIHCVKYFLSGVNPVDIRVGMDTFCNALEISSYFKEQAIYAYSCGDIDIGIAKAERVLNKIRSKGIRNIRQNDLYKLCRCSLFRNAADFSETVDMLEEYGYVIRITSKGSNNKKVADIVVNPNI